MEIYDCDLFLGHCVFDAMYSVYPFTSHNKFSIGIIIIKKYTQNNNKYTIFNEPLQREPAAPVHSVASRQLTGGNIVHLVLPSVIVSGANLAICSNGQTWKQPPGPIHHTLPLREGSRPSPFIAGTIILQMLVLFFLLSCGPWDHAHFKNTV